MFLAHLIFAGTAVIDPGARESNEKKTLYRQRVCVGVVIPLIIDTSLHLPVCVGPTGRGHDRQGKARSTPGAYGGDFSTFLLRCLPQFLS